MAAITIGWPAVYSSVSAGGTFSRGIYNPTSAKASGTGSITSIAFYITSSVSAGGKVGLLYNGWNNSITRSIYTLGSMSVGLNTISGLSMPVVLADSLGFYLGSGAIAYTPDTASTMISYNGDRITTGGAWTGGTLKNRFSCLGAGDTTPTGKKWNGITISKWNGAIVSKINNV